MNSTAARRLLTGGAWGAAAAIAFAVYLRLAGTRAVNSDGASQALQGWDQLHGDLLLRGWTTSDVSFSLTEVPQYALIELVRGLNAGDVHVAAAMTYTLVLALAALLALGRPTGRAGTSAGRASAGRAGWEAAGWGAAGWGAAARVAIAVGIMVAPQPGAGVNELLSSPDHIGTSVPLLLILLIIDRVRRPRWWRPAVLAILIGWADLSDSVVLLALVIPLVTVIAFRVARSGRPLAEHWDELALAGAAVAGFALAQLGYQAVQAAGGYAELPLGTPLAPLGVIAGHNLAITGQGLLLLPGADFLGRPAGSGTVVAVLHLAGVAAAAAGLALAARRFRRRDADLVNQLLAAGIVVNVIGFLVTTKVYDVASAREMAPALPFAAVLAGRELGPYLVSRRGDVAPGGRRGGPDGCGGPGGRGGPGGCGGRGRLAGVVALGLVLAGYLAGLGLELTGPSAAPQAAQLTVWLERHPLGTGLSGYWAANVVTLTSGDRVAVRSVTLAGGRLVPTPGNVRPAWFDPARSRADFVVLFPGLPGYGGLTDRRAVLAAFGPPARTYQVGTYTILCWPKNILADLP